MDKSAIRKNASDRRRNFLSAQKQEAITRSFLESDYYRNADNLFIYFSTEEEIDTHAIIRQALQDQKTVAIPLITGPGQMEARKIDSFEHLEKDRFGIPSPPDGSPVLSPESIDLIVVPGLQFSELGARLGYGGGYYDRYLKNLPDHITRVSLSLDELIGEVPEEPHDERVDLIITPKRMINTGAYSERNAGKLPDHFVATKGKWGMRLGLKTISLLLDKLGNPEKGQRYIHVAGTNGKGSMCAMLTAALTESGYRVGSYTSPELMHFSERILVNQEPIGDEDLNRLYQKIRKACEELVAEGEPEPTGFEIETALALMYYREKKTDINVIEVGLGGRLDATNIIPDPDLNILMSISLEHTQYLGDTLEEIAGEKAGIIKKGADVIAYPQSQKVLDVFRRKAKEEGASSFTVADPSTITCIHSDLTGHDLIYTGDKTPFSFHLGLAGEYQKLNGLTALTAIDALRKRGFHIPQDAVREALQDIRFPGRMEILNKSPLILIDGAHNEGGIRALRDTINHSFDGQKINLYFGMLEDKNVDLALDLLLPYAKRVFTLTPDSEIAVSAQNMASRIREKTHLPVKALSSPKEALDQALESSPGEINIFTGSLYMIGSLRKALFSLD